MRLAGLRAREGAVHVQVEEPLERADDVLQRVARGPYHAMVPGAVVRVPHLS